MPHLTTNLSGKLTKCDSFKESVSIFEKVLQNLNMAKSEVDKKIVKAVNLIEEYNGEAKISQIAEAVDLSTRQLERSFRQNSGLTPKQFSRVCRLRATSINLNETDMNWANRAAEMGFTDQAHLTGELSSLTGSSPKSFEKKIKDVKYDDLIKYISDMSQIYKTYSPQKYHYEYRTKLYWEKLYEIYWKDIFRCSVYQFELFGDFRTKTI